MKVNNKQSCKIHIITFPEFNLPSRQFVILATVNVTFRLCLFNSTELMIIALNF